jgi:peptidylprolyl isomerase/peptidyl-prolyl cis-trans isomerase B (cyclophilin B)
LTACISPGPANTPAPTDTPSTAAQAPATDTPAPPEASAATTDTQAAAGGAAEVPPPAEVAEGAASAVEPAARADMYSATPAMTVDPAKFYYATLKTQRGDIKVQLFADRAPATVNNFVFLAREGFYNDTTFHRVLDGFMAQGGDPTGTGAGGPGYTFADEFSPALGFDRPGLLAMANSGPGTNGSQFFITFAPTDWLNNHHTIFGEVVEGMDVLAKLTRRDPGASPAFEGDKLYTVLIEARWPQ